MLTDSEDIASALSTLRLNTSVTDSVLHPIRIEINDCDGIENLDTLLASSIMAYNFGLAQLGRARNKAYGSSIATKLRESALTVFSKVKTILASTRNDNELQGVVFIGLAVQYVVVLVETEMDRIKEAKASAEKLAQLMQAAELCINKNLELFHGSTAAAA